MSGVAARVRRMRCAAERSTSAQIQQIHDLDEEHRPAALSRGLALEVERQRARAKRELLAEARAHRGGVDAFVQRWRNHPSADESGGPDPDRQGRLERISIGGRRRRGRTTIECVADLTVIGLV